MYSKAVTVNKFDESGARPVAMLVQIASQFDSKITIETGSVKINAKSIMGMMSLGFKKGNELVIAAKGSDEKEAVSKIIEYVESEM